MQALTSSHFQSKTKEILHPHNPLRQNVNQETIDAKVATANVLLDILSLHEVDLRAALTHRFNTIGHGTLPVAQLLEAQRALLTQAQAQLVAAHEAVVAEAADDQPYREGRDRAIKKVLDVLQNARGLIDAAYGEEALDHFLLVAAPPETGEGLEDHAAQVVDRLRHAPLDMSSPFGFELDFIPIADRVETELIPLVTAMEDIRREAQEIRAALDALRLALTEFDAVYIGVSEALHAFFLLGRRPDLAELLQASIGA